MQSISSLPLEILHLICEFLAYEWVYSLSDLALVNKRLYEVASKHRFHHVKIRLSGRTNLASDATKWCQILERSSAFASVRHLTLWGEMPTLKVEADRRENDDTEAYGVKYCDDIEQGEDEDELTCVHKYYRSYHDDIVSVRNEDDYWGLLPMLIEKMSGLTDLVWACRTLLPPSVFQALGRGCRLHYVRFKLPSLHYADLHEERRDIDPYEFSIATSPSLTRIMATVSRCYRLDGVEFNGEALFELLKLAPNLKDVHIVRKYPHFGSIAPAMREVRLNPPPWPGFLIDDRRREQEYQRLDFPPTSSPTQLRTLSLERANEVDYLRSLQQHIVFSNLKHLQLWEVSRPFLGEVTRCFLPSLSSLALDPNIDYHEEGQIRADQAVSEFIASIASRLKSIHLSTCIIGSYISTRAIRAIFDVHGQTIEKLSLVGYRSVAEQASYLTVNQIREIGEACPNIRELRVPVHRRMGNPSEVNVYKALGLYIPQLRRLWLRLGCVYSEDDECDGFADRAARDMMINIAIDSVLSSSIMETIVNSSTSQPSLLSCLHLENGRSLGVPQLLGEILDKLDFRWKCLRVYDGGQMRVVTRRITRKNRDSEFMKGRIELGSYETVFRKLWPCESGFWEDDWRSFPLASVGDPFLGGSYLE